MQTVLFDTADGSHTLYNDTLGVYYHSVHGALQESVHIFINLGLKAAIQQATKEQKSQISIFEMGFGTGLNALLTWIEADRHRFPIHHVTVEAYPAKSEQCQSLNYDNLLNFNGLHQIHQAEWGKPVVLSKYFTIEKHHTKLQDFETNHCFEAVYYDAFAPAAQPELWEQSIFEKIATWLHPTANLTTYCSKSYVRRNLEAAGFKVEKHPGPCRKREVIRAIYQAAPSTHSHPVP
ncbi:MAG: tRNA (5-methylaminomethyl-2-thiouridine)(34)-methyltransferase MnmD [Runella sp.]